MATLIDLKNINMIQLKANAKAFNGSGLLPEPLEIRVGVKKQDLAIAYVKGIETCNDIGQLDNVPEDVYNYYVSIVQPTDGRKAEAVPAATSTSAPAAATLASPPIPTAAPAGQGAAPVAAPKSRGAGKAMAAAPAGSVAAQPPAQPKSKKVTRADVFAQIVLDRTPRTKQQIESEMLGIYQGSDKEAAFWTTAYVRLCLSLNIMTKADDGTLVIN